MTTTPPHLFRARATSADLTLATSTEAIRVERAGGPPELCFPIADVRLESLQDEGRTIEGAAGTARLLSLAGEVDPRPRGRWTAQDLPASVDGVAAAWRYTDGSALADHVAFDPRRVRVEVLDTVEGEDPRDMSVKRFPTWGDAADLIGQMDVAPTGFGR